MSLIILSSNNIYNLFNNKLFYKLPDKEKKLILFYKIILKEIGISNDLNNNKYLLKSLITNVDFLEIINQFNNLTLEEIIKLMIYYKNDDNDYGELFNNFFKLLILSKKELTDIDNLIKNIFNSQIKNEINHNLMIEKEALKEILKEYNKNLKKIINIKTSLPSINEFIIIIMNQDKNEYNEDIQYLEEYLSTLNNIDHQDLIEQIDIKKMQKTIEYHKNFDDNKELQMIIKKLELFLTKKYLIFKKNDIINKYLNILKNKKKEIIIVFFVILFFMMIKKKYIKSSTKI